MTPDDKSEYREMVSRYRGRLRAIESELSDIEERKSDLERESANIRKLLPTVLELAGQAADPNDLSQLGFTDAIRNLLSSSGSRMSAAEIKEGLTQKGFPISRYGDPMASIYKILGRLAPGEIEVIREGFKVFYKTRRKKSGLRRPNPFFGGLASPDNSAMKGAGNEPQPTTTTNKTE